MKKSILNIITICLLFSVINLEAQVPTPANTQENAIILLGATAHLGNGEVINNSLVAFDNGKITHVSSVDDSGLNLSDYKVFDVKTKHIYPGLILPSVGLGLVEVGSVKATVDAAEIGTYNPNVRSIVAYNTDSETIPVLRSNGILLAQVTPVGGVISGTSSSTARCMELGGCCL